MKKQITLEQLKRLVKEEAEYEDEEQYLATFKLVGTLQAGDPTDLDQDGIESCLEETTDMKEVVSDCIEMIDTILQDAMVNTDVKLAGKIRKVPFDQA